MKFRFIKIITILISFFFLTGFLPFVSLLGPSLTAITSGNIYKAGAQYVINDSIKKKTGKDSLNLVKEKIENQEKKKDLNEDLRKLVEKRIYLARKKLNFKNLNQ
tara:strand:- start:546 stop:860 length:315 start_codon:yes stop_codon:yes gene_type:complete